MFCTFSDSLCIARYKLPNLAPRTEFLQQKFLLQTEISSTLSEIHSVYLPKSTRDPRDLNQLFQHIPKYHTNLVEASNYIKQHQNDESHLKSKSMNFELSNSISCVETHQINSEWLQILHTSHKWHNWAMKIFRIGFRPRYQKVNPSVKLPKNSTFGISSLILLRTSK